MEIARAWLLPRDQRWDLDQPASVRLQVLYDDDDQQQLVWSVLRGRGRTGRARAFACWWMPGTVQIIQGGVVAAPQPRQLRQLPAPAGARPLRPGGTSPPARSERSASVQALRASRPCSMR